MGAGAKGPVESGPFAAGPNLLLRVDADERGRPSRVICLPVDEDHTVEGHMPRRRRLCGSGPKGARTPDLMAASQTGLKRCAEEQKRRSATSGSPSGVPFFAVFQSGTFTIRFLLLEGGNYGQQGQGRFEELEDRGEQVAEGEAPGEEGKGRSSWLFLDGNLDQQVARGVRTEEGWSAAQALFDARTMRRTRSWMRSGVRQSCLIGVDVHGSERKAPRGAEHRPNVWP